LISISLFCSLLRRSRSLVGWFIRWFKMTKSLPSLVSVGVLEKDTHADVMLTWYAMIERRLRRS